MKTNNHYNPKLQGFAHENRAGMTKAETCLWKYALSKKQILGYTFRRQRPIEDAEVLQHINMVRMNIEGWVKKLTEDSES